MARKQIGHLGRVWELTSRLRFWCSVFLSPVFIKFCRPLPFVDFYQIFWGAQNFVAPQQKAISLDPIPFV